MMRRFGGVLSNVAMGGNRIRTSGPGFRSGSFEFDNFLGSGSEERQAVRS